MLKRLKLKRVDTKNVTINSLPKEIIVLIFDYSILFHDYNNNLRYTCRFMFRIHSEYIQKYTQWVKKI